LANAVEAWSGPKCCWLQLLWMLQLLLLRCMWHVAVDTRNYCHWAWLGFSVSGFSCLFAGFSAFSFQFSTFLFSRRLSSLKTVNCIFIQFSIICLGSCSSGLCNFQMKYFPNAIHFCANCFPRLGFLCLRPLSAYFVFPLASVWPFHLAKSYLKLVKRRQTEITQLGNCRTCEMASHHIRFLLNY